jgi:two-component system, response regulator, stage 0 sporulation protein F
MNKVLIVDDERDVEFLFRQHFRKEVRASEMELHFAFSGEEAMEFLSTRKPFDIVLVMSDINMPGMSGLELLRDTTRLFPELRVIMVTAYDDERNRNTARENGAYGFLTKPVDFDKLRQMLNTKIS